MMLVTNGRVRTKLGALIREAEAGVDVVVVNRKERRAVVRLVVVTDLDLDFDQLEEDREIYL